MIATHLVLKIWVGIDLMKTYLSLFFVMILISGCGDDYPFLDTREFDRKKEDPLQQQMQAALLQRPKGIKDSEHVYFHVPSNLEEKDLQERALYLYDFLTMPNKKLVSLSCTDIYFCQKISSRALELIIKSGRLEEKLLMLPDYLDPPYQKARQAGISIILYDTPSLKAKGSD